jgi:hypothetical protein
LNNSFNVIGADNTRVSVAVYVDAAANRRSVNDPPVVLSVEACADANADADVEDGRGGVAAVVISVVVLVVPLLVSVAAAFPIRAITPVGCSIEVVVGAAFFEALQLLLPNDIW